MVWFEECFLSFPLSLSVSLQLEQIFSGGVGVEEGEGEGKKQVGLGSMSSQKWRIICFWSVRDGEERIVGKESFASR